MIPFLVAFAGPSGSGKSSLARAIRDALPDDECAMFSLDSYYRDLAHLDEAARATVNFDHPEALDAERFLHDLDALRAGLTIEVPEYDFTTHTRGPRGRRLQPKPLILVEGIFAFAWPGAATRFDLKVYIELAAETCLIRRMARDVRERGRDEEEVRTRFETHVRPSLDLFVEPQRHTCDLVLSGASDLDEMTRTCLGLLPRLK